MSNVDKKNALVVTGVVIANGIPDTYGDVLNKEDIRKLMSSFVNQRTDTNHNYLKNLGVSFIENFETTTAITIGGREVPVSSWVSRLLVSDENLKQMIITGELNGLSLASSPNDPKVLEDYINQGIRPNYRDFADKDELDPKIISIVKGPANGFPLDYMPYQAYLERKKMEEESMTESNHVSDAIAMTEAILGFIERNQKEPDPAPAPSVDETKFEEINKQLADITAMNEELSKKSEEDSKLIQELTEELKAIKESAPSNEGEDEGDGETGNEENPAGEGDGETTSETVEGSTAGTEGNVERSSQFSTTGVENHGNSNYDEPVWDDGFTPRRRDAYGRPIND